LFYFLTFNQPIQEFRGDFMNLPLITAGLSGILLATQQLLMLNVGLYRIKLRLGVGHGNDPNLERLIRRHGNLAENAGIFLVTLALTEILLGSRVVVLGFGLVFLLARILHLLGFSSLAGSHLAHGNQAFLFCRSAGATLSAVLGILLGGYLTYTVLQSL
jgi:hypothetical protein